MKVVGKMRSSPSLVRVLFHVESHQLGFCEMLPFGEPLQRLLRPLFFAQRSFQDPRKILNCPLQSDPDIGRDLGLLYE